MYCHTYTHYISVFLYTEVTLIIPGPLVITTPIPPYVRVSPYAGVTLTIPRPSLDNHSYMLYIPLFQSIPIHRHYSDDPQTISRYVTTSIPPYFRVSPYTGVTLTVPDHLWIDNPISFTLYQNIPVHQSYSDSPRTIHELPFLYTPYVRAPYTEVILIVPGPSVDSHSYTATPIPESFRVLF